MSTSVLIVSFSMPPSPNIGGRRWVKFAKYLKRNGHLVKLIAAKENFSEPSPWADDLELLKNDIVYLESHYPKYLGIRPTNVLEKILYRLSLFYMKLRSQGNYYDKSNLWTHSLVDRIREKIIKYDIKNIICTVPPFKMAYYILNLKKEFPQVNFIVDYRDPWTNNRTAFGFTSLTTKRFELERDLEKEVIQGYDKITAVSSEMFKYLATFSSRTLDTSKFLCIPNGYDKDDFAGLKQEGTNDDSKNKIKIVFAGTFYDQSIHVLEKLVEVIKQIGSDFPAKKEHLQFIFAGSMPLHIKSFIESNKQNFSYLGVLNLKDTYKLIHSADFCALFLTDDLNYSLSTKFYEYLALKKPIISFSRVKGANAQFIEKHQLGIGIEFNNMYQSLKQLIHREININLNEEMEFKEFEVINLVKQVENILKY